MWCYCHISIISVSTDDHYITININATQTPVQICNSTLSLWETKQHTSAHAYFSSQAVENDQAKRKAPFKPDTHVHTHTAVA